MLGADPFWERIRLAYEFDHERRTTYIRTEELSPDEIRRGVVLQPGEIGYCKAGVELTFYEFLVERGYQLIKAEREELQYLRRDRAQYDRGGKPCLVLQRLEGGKYVVALLATYRNIIHGKNIASPAGQFFSISMGGTPRWPPGCPQIQTTPPWNGNAFLFAVPVVRDDIQFNSSFKRQMLAPGELDRVRQIISAKLKVFDGAHKTLRTQHLRWRQNIRDLGGINNVTFVPSDGGGHSDNLLHQIRSSSISAKARRKRPLLRTYARITGVNEQPKEPFSFRWQRQYPFKIKLTPLLHVPRDWNNVRWLWRYLRHDIMNSSLYLNSYPPLRPPIRLVRFPTR